MQSKVRALDVRIFNQKRKFFTVLFVLTLPYFTYCSKESQGKTKLEKIKYNKLLDDETGFKPINVIRGDTNNLITEIFTKDGQFRVFAEKDTSLLNLSVYEGSNGTNTRLYEFPGKDNDTKIEISQLRPVQTTYSNLILGPPVENNKKEPFNVQQLEDLFLDYVKDNLNNKSFELFPGFRMDVRNNSSNNNTQKTSWESLDVILLKKLYHYLDMSIANINKPRAVETGRLFFFKGLKKILWPLFIGVQIAKSILLALFLPSILGSIGKIVGKGISSVSGFNHPSETINDLDFKDNTYNFDEDNTKYNDYMYPQAEASTNHFATQMYDAAAINNNALSRFGFGDQKATYVNTRDGMYNAKNNNQHNIIPSNKNTFQVFHDIPASSLLLTNYDPFYSPLLSRLDAVFQQLGPGSGDEFCREKLVCLMYANPAKFAPYSNLISAQLSRELNELRKPTSDNPDILRFFKYMKAAKDGQDGVNCEQSYIDCTSFKESENPAMLATYHDINKLVQARKFRK